MRKIVDREGIDFAASLLNKEGTSFSKELICVLESLKDPEAVPYKESMYDYILNKSIFVQQIKKVLTPCRKEQHFFDIIDEISEKYDHGLGKWIITSDDIIVNNEMEYYEVLKEICHNKEGTTNIKYIVRLLTSSSIKYALNRTPEAKIVKFGFFNINGKCKLIIKIETMTGKVLKCESFNFTKKETLHTVFSALINKYETYQNALFQSGLKN